MKYLEENRKIWDERSENNDTWSVPVTSEMVQLAKEGIWSIVLTPTKPVPSNWFPEKLYEKRILCLASGGGQQGPILAATGAIVGVCFGITDFVYWLFITDLGVVRECVGQGIGTALVKKLHELAGGIENIIMYTCVNENAIPFYEKIGMRTPNDVMVYNHVEWTDFVVE